VTEASVSVHANGDSVRLILSGEIDTANAAAVEDEINEAIPNQVSAVSVDLSDIAYLDSAGLRILFGLATRLPILQIRLEVVAPLASPARRVIELAGLPRLVPVLPA
jgi:anti-anti-sigma factor